jgi:hypothetical protein
MESWTPTKPQILDEHGILDIHQTPNPGRKESSRKHGILDTQDTHLESLGTWNLGHPQGMHDRFSEVGVHYFLLPVIESGRI